MLTVTNLNQYYGESHTLWDFNLKVEKGGCTVLMGRNGVGKSTLLKTIMGLVPVKSGSIHFDGQELSACPAELRARLGIGYVPQGREIFGQLTVEENLRTALAAGRTRGEELPARLFELFPVLKQMLRRRGGDLSGGQQQQLAIGRALVLNPTLLILDEPCEGIQPNIVHQIGDVIRHLNQEEGMTVLLVEQKLPFARRVGRHFCLVEKGRQVAAGSIVELDGPLIHKYLAV